MLSFMKLFNTPTFKHEAQCRHLDRNKMSQAKKDKFIEKGKEYRGKSNIICNHGYSIILCPYTRNSKEEYFWLKGFWS